MSKLVYLYLVWHELPLYTLKYFSVEVFPLIRTTEGVCSNKEIPVSHDTKTRKLYLFFMSLEDEHMEASIGSSTNPKKASLKHTLFS